MRIPKLSNKEFEILGMLVARNEMYGLELVRESGGKLKRGTVYVTLGRMLEKGLVESRIGREDQVAGRPRRIFRATGFGVRVFQAWELADDLLAEGR